ncbi:MAG TPA: transglutaminase family protein [Mycobacteriales bacterium]|nr:transglutaminase family protein [Mycobacteriales bacterium]
MSWRIRVRHSTGYRYDAPVLASYNEARLTPVTDVDQLTLEARVVTSPDATQQRYWDYWGTQVTAFDLHVPHDALEVTATCVVDTADARPVTDVPGWDVLRSEAVRDRYVEMLSPTARSCPGEEMTELVRERSSGLDPHETALAVMDLVHERVAYQSGSTGVSTSAHEAWSLGSGVCQDIAHVTVGLLRAVGLPASYVSGYLHPNADAVLGETLTGESHAWVEVWLGGWWPYDPTNRMPAGERHVVVGRGRDYGDVTPLKGIYSGTGSHSLGVTVEVTRLA